MANFFNYKDVTVQVTDARGKWAEGKPVGNVIALFNKVTNIMELTIPEVQKRDTTKNPALVRGDKSGMEVTVRKDGRYGFSWPLKQGELRLLGKQAVVQEFAQCMDVLFSKIS